VIQATYLATEAALRLMKPGKSSYEVTEAVQKIAQEFGCVPVQGISACIFLHSREQLIDSILSPSVFSASSLASAL
jgi:methionine aminopeptidase